MAARVAAIHDLLNAVQTWMRGTKARSRASSTRFCPRMTDALAYHSFLMPGTSTEKSGLAMAQLALRRLGVMLESDQRQRRAGGGAAFVALLPARSRPGLAVIIDRKHAVADRHAPRHRQVEQSTRGLLSHDLEMQRFATDHAAERDNTI